MDPNVFHKVRIFAEDGEFCGQVIRGRYARVASEIVQDIAV